LRLPRPQITDCCVHVTHRCQEGRFLLKFDLDRAAYRRRLFEASRRFRRLRFLDYTITSNHVHLLVWAPRMADLSEMMHWLQGSAAVDRNRRKGRHGAVWSGRFHPTLVQSGSHLSRCLFYLDMNMVRAGVVGHPFEWPFGGAVELGGQRRRCRVIDQARLLACLGMPGRAEAFQAWYRATLAELCRTPAQPPEPYWAKAFAVGDRAWLSGLGGAREDLSAYVQPAGPDSGPAAGTCVLQPPQSVLRRLWHRLTERTTR